MHIDHIMGSTTVRSHLISDEKVPTRGHPAAEQSSAPESPSISSPLPAAILNWRKSLPSSGTTTAVQSSVTPVTSDGIRSGYAAPRRAAPRRHSGYADPASHPYSPAGSPLTSHARLYTSSADSRTAAGARGYDGDVRMGDAEDGDEEEEEWPGASDDGGLSMKEKRKAQNRIAQTKYRARAKLQTQEVSTRVVSHQWGQRSSSSPHAGLRTFSL